MNNLDRLAKSNPAVTVAKSQLQFIRDVAKKLREMREEKQLSQARMADLLGVSQPRIAQLESGRPGDAPSLEQIAAYAYYCDSEAKSLEIESRRAAAVAY